MKTHKHVLIIALLTAFLAAFSPLGSAAGVQRLRFRNGTMESILTAQRQAL